MSVPTSQRKSVSIRRRSSASHSIGFGPDGKPDKRLLRRTSSQSIYDPDEAYDKYFSECNSERSDGDEVVWRSPSMKSNTSSRDTLVKGSMRWKSMREQQAEHILQLDIAIQAIRNITWEASLAKVIAWTEEPFQFPVETAELPKKLHNIVVTLLKELKMHREILGCLARTFKPWETFLLEALDHTGEPEPDRPAASEPERPADTERDKRGSWVSDTDRPTSWEFDGATATEVASPTNTEDQADAASTPRPRIRMVMIGKPQQPPREAPVAGEADGEDTPKTLADLWRRRNAVCDGSSTPGLERQCAEGRKEGKAFNAVAMSWMIRTESNVDEVTNRMNSLEARMGLLERRLDNCLHDVMSASRSGPEQFTEMGLLSRPHKPSPKVRDTDEKGLLLRRTASDNGLQKLGSGASIMWSEIEKLITRAVQKSHLELDEELAKHQRVIGSLFDSIQSRHQENRDSLDLHAARLDKLEARPDHRNLQSKMARLRERLREACRIISEQLYVEDHCLSDSGSEDWASEQPSRRFSRQVSNWNTPRNTPRPGPRHSVDEGPARYGYASETAGKLSELTKEVVEFSRRLTDLESAAEALQTATVPEIYDLVDKYRQLATNELQQLQAAKNISQRAEAGVRQMGERLAKLDEAVRNLPQAQVEQPKPAQPLPGAMPARATLPNCFAPPSSLTIGGTPVTTLRKQNFSIPQTPRVEAVQQIRPPSPSRLHRPRRNRPLTAPRAPAHLPGPRPVTPVTPPPDADLAAPDDMSSHGSHSSIGTALLVPG